MSPCRSEAPERALPRGVLRKRKALRAHALGIERRQVDREPLCRALGALDAVCPVRASELAELRRRLLVPAADVLLHAVELVGWNVQPVATAIFD